MDDLIEAVIIDDVAKVQQLLEKGVNPDGFEDEAKVRPLHFAAQHNAIGSAQLLIAMGADINAQTTDGMTPLKVAIIHSHYEIIALLEHHLKVWKN